MNETALNRFWELLGWVLALKFEAFEQINILPYGSTVAFVVVLAVSLSQQVVAQSVILFVNRVTPVRFVFTLLIGAVLFAFGYFFLVLSTWLISFAPLTVEARFELVARTLGFSYAPLIFTTVWQAFGTVALGWFTLWVMQRTIGQPSA
ncbi:hypothetical protein [Chroogloeocystis siderophila]|jgi:hypothetical protein|uniref:Yip1 domain-containing protein n=1 Tax=Chroogloeocystis siderophila 5.2 s.c.1 TaxID=247279 RepID=A0A1U7HAR2_9CHRO|nr:hypothetical protein [Chroogloeocystis siderophila]OKH20670.1 hypothetical protein NIES1031_22915 [Chroogloeocystis siderophila 5.2 s.c.1]